MYCDTFVKKLDKLLSLILKGLSVSLAIFLLKSYNVETNVNPTLFHFFFVLFSIITAILSHCPLSLPPSLSLTKHYFIFIFKKKSFFLLSFWFWYSWILQIYSGKYDKLKHLLFLGRVWFIFFKLGFFFKNRVFKKCGMKLDFLKKLSIW